MENEDKFRDEILAFQAAQRDVTRWKIIGLGALAAIGLGIEGNSNKDMAIILCIAPLFAPYCDLICREYEIRIGIIGTFLLKHGDFCSKYELFIDSDDIKKTEWWKVMTYTYLLPSYGVCILVFSAALSIFLVPNLVAHSTFTAIVLSISAIIGFVLTSMVQQYFEKTYQKIVLDIKEKIVLDIKEKIVLDIKARV